MTIAELRQHHSEFDHSCIVEAGIAPDLIVRCADCGDRLEAELVSPCLGGRHTGRVIVMMRCPNCGKTGQLRFEEPSKPLPVPKTLSSMVAIREGGPGYVMLECNCGTNGATMALTKIRTAPGELVLEGASFACGHPVKLRMPRNVGYARRPHLHR